LEFEFLNEEGFGLGPTLEFYSLLGTEFKKPQRKLLKKLASEEYFPFPIDPQRLKMLKKSAPTSKEFIEISEISKCFKLMGILIGRAILDEKIFDFPLSRIFWDLVLHRVQIFHYSSDFYFS